MHLHRPRQYWRLPPPIIAPLVFVLLFTSTIFVLKYTSSHDPSSVFFDPVSAFEPIYSATRRQQAIEYFSAISQHGIQRRDVRTSPRIAVGIVTIQRREDYFQAAVGSLLDGLSKEERDEIHLTFFIANTDPYVHIAYNQTWFYDLPDRVMTYHDVPEAEKARLRQLEANDPKHRFKPLQDWMRLLENGYKTGAPYVIMLEDDVLAMDGWHHRTISALERLEARQDISKILYLRLFFNSRLHGWNKENWRSYLTISFATTVTFSVIMYKLRRRCRSIRRFLPGPLSFLFIISICVPACIGLFFAAGRLTVLPIRHGLIRMDRFGCCAQALAFPRAQIPGLLDHYARAIEAEGGYADSLTELYAAEAGLQRWALVPSVFQHVGAQSSKGDKSKEFTRWHRTAAQNIWNFEFERFDAAALEKQHAAYLRALS